MQACEQVVPVKLAQIFQHFKNEDSHRSPSVHSPFSLVPWLAAAAGAAALIIYALVFEPSVASWSAKSAPFALLFTGLAFASCCLPASAPLYSDRVRATAVVALAAVLTLPPALASLPILVAGAALISMLNERSTRLETLGHVALIVLSQLTTAVILRSRHMLPISYAHLGIVHFVFVSLWASVLFGCIYLGGLLIAHLAPILFRASKSGVGRGWRIFWANEAYVYLGGAPVAAVFSLILIANGTLVGAALATAGVACLGFLNHVLGERRILQNQVLALEALTRRGMIDESASVDQLLKEFLLCCRRLILFNRARVWIYNDAEMLLEKVCELSPDFLPAKNVETTIGQRSVRRLGEELVGRVAERAAPLIVRDARRDARHPLYRLSAQEKAQLGPVSLLELPLIACGDVVGVVEFERNAWAAYTSSDKLRVQSLATLVAMSVSNIEQHRSICRQAVTDGLTGLYNKRHILQILADEVRRAERYRHPLSAMMLDLDSFKAYNDDYGHLQGDVLLQQLAHLIQRNVRSADSAGRYGGEEFILVMPETDKPAALVIAERIRSQVEAARFPGASYSASSPNAITNFVDIEALAAGSDEGYTRKTISIGVATYPQDTDDIQKLLALADDALYRAKRGGRNQVVSAEALPVIAQ